MKTVIFLLLFVISASAQPCNLTLKDAPTLREGLRLGMNVGDVSKAFALEPDHKRSTDQIKIGKIAYDDVTFELFFHNEELSSIHADYLDKPFKTAGDFSSVITDKFKIPGGFRFYYDAYTKEIGWAWDCRDFTIVAFDSSRLMLVNTLLFDTLEKERKAAEAAELKRKSKAFKP